MGLGHFLCKLEELGSEVLAVHAPGCKHLDNVLLLRVDELLFEHFCIVHVDWPSVVFRDFGILVINGQFLSLGVCNEGGH